VGTSYLLTSAIFQPLIVALSNDFGRRKLLFLSVVLFTLGTIICCLSQNFTTLLAGRCVQGTGGAGILSLNYVILSDIVPLRQRAIYIAITQLSWSVGAIAGPLVGGLFADHATWRWIFYVNFPFCAVGLVMIPFSVNLRVQVPSLEARLLRFDWLGTVLFTSSVTSFLLGLTLGGSRFAWDSWHIIVPIVIGAVGLVATVVWEMNLTKNPMLRVELLNSRSGCAAYICVFLQGLLVSLPDGCQEMNEQVRL
jgi:MFS family permease